MNSKVRIEIDAETAELLNERAAARGISVSDLIADLAGGDALLSPDLETMRAAGEGPWSDVSLAEEVSRLAEFHRTGEAVPWEEAKAWIESWGTLNERPQPKPRKI